MIRISFHVQYIYISVGYTRIYCTCRVLWWGVTRRGRLGQTVGGGGGGHTIPMGKWVKVSEREREISFRESQKLGVIDRDWNVYNNIYGYTV